MIRVECSSKSVERGDVGQITVSSELGRQYRNVQLDVMQCAVANPRESWSSGISTEGHETKTFAVQTAHMEPGFYEAVAVRFHDDDAGLPHRTFVGGRDFPRCFLHVRSGGEPLSAEGIAGAIEVAERMLNESFMAGVVLPNGSKGFQCFVFANGVRLTRRIRFHNCDVVPARGLGSPVHEWVNEFFHDAMGMGIAFEPNPAFDQQIRDGNPACVARFPKIVAANEQSALEYATKEFEQVLEALALIRGGFGRIVCAVVGDTSGSGARLHARRTDYRGNLLGGSLSGEDPYHIVQSLDQLRAAPFRYLASLYAEALRESNRDFEYVRYWQILETAAESKNFDPKAPLLDVSGQPILDTQGRPRAIRNAAAIVFELLKTDHKNSDGSLNANSGVMRVGLHGTNITLTLWRRVQVWLAFRNAAAHFGGFRPGDSVQRDRFHDYALCEEAWADITSAGHDFFLASLKDCVSLHIRRALNQMS